MWSSNMKIIELSDKDKRRAISIIESWEKSSSGSISEELKQIIIKLHELYFLEFDGSW